MEEDLTGEGNRREIRLYQPSKTADDDEDEKDSEMTLNKY
jgi:hypothetical protein